MMPMTSKADKLPLETEPVDRDDNTIFTLKPGDQTFVSPYFGVFVSWKTIISLS